MILAYIAVTAALYVVDLVFADGPAEKRMKMFMLAWAIILAADFVK